MKSLTIKNILLRLQEQSAQSRRSLGIGYIGLAHYLAKNHVSYGDKEALELVDEITEAFQYYLLKASQTTLHKKKANVNISKRLNTQTEYFQLTHTRKT